MWVRYFYVETHAIAAPHNGGLTRFAVGAKYARSLKADDVSGVKNCWHKLVLDADRLDNYVHKRNRAAAMDAVSHHVHNDVTEVGQRERTGRYCKAATDQHERRTDDKLGVLVVRGLESADTVKRVGHSADWMNNSLGGCANWANDGFHFEYE